MSEKTPGGIGPFGVTEAEVSARLAEFRHRIDAGAGDALFEAIDYCMFLGIAAPDWLARAYEDCWSRWQSLDAATLDEAFGVEPRRHLAAKRAMARLGYAVLDAVEFARREKIPVDDQLFDVIGEVLGIGKTRAKEFLKVARHLRKEKAEAQKRQGATLIATVGGMDARQQDRLYARIRELKPQRRRI